MRYRILPGVTAIAVSFLLTACGGGGGSGEIIPPVNGGSSSSSSSSSGGSSSSSSSSSGGSSSSSSSGGMGDVSVACEKLATDPTVNWRDSAELDTDQKIVECLSKTLGNAVGYGEDATGGYDAAGNSKLVVIEKNQSVSVEQQIYNAVSSDDYNWIVFDKEDFAQETEVSMHRVYCGRSEVQSAIGGTEQQCVNYQDWCSANGVEAGEACVAEFFNTQLNQDGLPIGNTDIGSNTTLDGRGSGAYFRFNGFEIRGVENVILTHLDFRGAGHIEDHELDPDMIRSDASHDIWIHKNSFELTGDSAFDVKQGASGITMSFNRLLDVKRASLHGSSDDRTVNKNITTTMHHNAFITTDDNFSAFSGTARRVPLIRRGKTHMFNNVFLNYRKDVFSARVGAQVLWENNALMVNSEHGVALGTLRNDLARDNYSSDDADNQSNFRTEGTFVWHSDSACNLNSDASMEIVSTWGEVGNLPADYSQASQDSISAELVDAGQPLVDYLIMTAGKGGEAPFNSPLANSQDYVVDLKESSDSCQ
ncbi:pectate lyase family protein [Microbulbifer celer]|uniref:Pectate lyase n=1 Tax=Microbulbifer celer TaxID=435905 RepID=A0ABW3U9C6_9GAMM|nr:pectate lyase [Microbulbifer celer]UFN57345.1 pectate lyase [Microbulbifer celer]